MWNIVLGINTVIRVNNLDIIVQFSISFQLQYPTMKVVSEYMGLQNQIKAILFM